MGLKAGIVGLPNVGKSTLFNAITKKNILAANYPFATIEPNVGVVIVPDKRLDFLVSLYNPKSIVPTSFEFIDIAGLVKGASSGEGLGNKFLSHIRDVDLICEVVRCFDDENITHVEGATNPIRDIEIINTELILADLEIIDSRINKIEKKATTTKDKDALKELNLLKYCKENLEKNIPLRNLEYSIDDENILKNFNFITLKKVIYVSNVDEDGIYNGGNSYSEEVSKYAEDEGSESIVMCAKLESDLASLSEDEKKEFLKEIGIEESGLDRLILSSYKFLGLRTFFTSGIDECRAWTFKNGMKAPACAGLIHTDFERGFIKAEVMSYDDLYTFKSEAKVKEQGKLRLEGKDYLVEDGDIIYFRFNV